MKKKAFILGNMDSNLGVQKDIDDFTRFLTSLEGGAWNNSEIDIMKNPSKSSLLDQINSYKDEKYDYFLFLFGGHGNTHNGKTHFYPNSEHDYDISEDYFDKISNKQLSIFDCCRMTRQIKSHTLSTESAIFESAANYLSREEVRKIYHECLQSAVNQSLKLYSCSIDEYAQDDDGGLYTQNLIRSAQQVSNKSVRTVSAIQVHNSTVPIVAEQSDNKQNPTYKGLLRVQETQQLVFAVNPKRCFF